MRLSYDLDEVMRPLVIEEYNQLQSAGKIIEPANLFLWQEDFFEGWFEFIDPQNVAQQVFLANEDLGGFLFSLQELKSGNTVSFKEDYGVTSGQFVGGEVKGQKLSLRNDSSMITGIDFAEFFDAMMLLKKILFIHIAKELKLSGVTV